MIEFVNAEIQYDQSRIFRRLRIEPDTYVYEYSNEHFPELVEQVKDNLHMLHCFCFSQSSRMWMTAKSRWCACPPAVLKFCRPRKI